MTRIEAPSRLHFGLLSLPVVGGHDRWPDGFPKRQFGGVGLMIDAPVVRVSVTPATSWSARGPSAERALGFARTLASSLPDAPAFSIEVECCPDQHIGLGTGTALALSVVKAIAVEIGHEDWPAVELAKRVGRGARSAIGIHGFDLGGLIVESGKLPGEDVASLVGRYEFPPEWRIVLVRPAGGTAWHGPREREAFSRLTQANPIEALCRIVLTGLLPALVANDLDGFGEALHEYNTRAGEGFTEAQRGTYTSAEVAACVRTLRQEGVRGVGQSSWGPMVFALVADEENAAWLRERLATLPTRFRPIIVASGAHIGARINRE